MGLDDIAASSGERVRRVIDGGQAKPTIEDARFAEELTRQFHGAVGGGALRDCLRCDTGRHGLLGCA
jgi:hypothetical protein